MNKRKLDTIHIHELNVIIIICLMITFAFEYRSKIISPIFAISESRILSSNKQFDKLARDIDDAGDNNKISIKVNSDKLEDKIVGMSAVIYDINNNTSIWSYNANKSSSLASLTKVMTAYTYKRHCDREIYFSGLKWSSDDAIRFMLIESSNEMADALAYNCMKYSEFIKAMNGEAQALGLNLNYNNSSGIDTPGVIGGRGDALSVASFFGIASMKYPELFDSTTHSSSLVPVSNFDGQSLIQAINTNKNIDHTIGARLSKTGLTDYAGGNLGIVYDVYLGRPIAIVVLGSTKDGRFKDVEILKDSVYTQY